MQIVIVIYEVCGEGIDGSHEVRILSSDEGRRVNAKLTYGTEACEGG